MSTRQYFCFVLINVKTTELIVPTRVGQCKQLIFLVALQHARTDTCYWQGLVFTVHLQHIRYDVVANIKINHIPVNCTYQNRVASSEKKILAAGAGNTGLCQMMPDDVISTSTLLQTSIYRPKIVRF